MSMPNHCIKMISFLAALSLQVWNAGTCWSEEPGSGSPLPSSGMIHELKLGFLKHDVDNLWSSFSREEGWDINLEMSLTPSVELWGGLLRPALGGSLNHTGDTSKIYLDGRWERDLDNALYTSIGLGLALHDGEKKLVRNDRKALGSTLLIHVPLELGYRLDLHNSLSLYFDHMSNAYTQSENEGMDSLGIRYGYRF
ncbi:MAG: acyloxyacyl hydrolase [Magnetococcales bacterium]|nr:acyloxyacyl hydrolase [Magnetococcales bacterium]